MNIHLYYVAPVETISTATTGLSSVLMHLSYSQSEDDARGGEVSGAGDREGRERVTAPPGAPDTTVAFTEEDSVQTTVYENSLEPQWATHSQYGLR